MPALFLLIVQHHVHVVVRDLDTVCRESFKDGCVDRVPDPFGPDLLIEVDGHGHDQGGIIVLLPFRIRKIRLKEALYFWKTQRLTSNYK